MEPSEINAVELVRRIRDQHYALLAGKAPTEVQAFFHREAAASNAEAERLFRERITDPQRAHTQSGREAPHGATSRRHGA